MHIFLRKTVQIAQNGVALKSSFLSELFLYTGELDYLVLGL
jgi:hypothetical protein